MKVSIIFRLYLGEAGSRDARIDAVVRSRSNVTTASIMVGPDGSEIDLLGFLDEETMSTIRYELCERWEQQREDSGPPEDWLRDPA